jgi:hypothetical protein
MAATGEPVSTTGAGVTGMTAAGGGDVGIETGATVDVGDATDPGAGAG